MFRDVVVVSVEPAGPDTEAPGHFVEIFHGIREADEVTGTVSEEFQVNDSKMAFQGKRVL